MGMAILLLSFFRIRQADVAGMRKRNAKSIAKRKLSKASKLVQSNNEAFFDEIHKALLGYLGDRFSLQQTDMNREHIAQVLKENNVSDPVINEVKDCLNDCEMVRFAPGAVRGKAEVLSAAEHVIREIEHELA